MLREAVHSRSCATFFRHSTVLSPQSSCCIIQSSCCVIQPIGEHKLETCLSHGRPPEVSCVPISLVFTVPHPYCQVPFQWQRLLVWKSRRNHCLGTRKVKFQFPSVATFSRPHSSEISEPPPTNVRHSWRVKPHNLERGCCYKSVQNQAEVQTESKRSLTYT